MVLFEDLFARDPCDFKIKVPEKADLVIKRDSFLRVSDGKVVLCNLIPNKAVTLLDDLTEISCRHRQSIF